MRGLPAAIRGRRDWVAPFLTAVRDECCVGACRVGGNLTANYSKHRKEFAEKRKVGAASSRAGRVTRAG